MIPRKYIPPLNATKQGVTLSENHNPNLIREPDQVTKQVFATKHQSNWPTPVNASAFTYLLEGYENKDFIVKGFSEGFLVNFEGEEDSLVFKFLSRLI